MRHAASHSSIRNKGTTYRSTKKRAGTQRSVKNSPIPPNFFFPPEKPGKGHSMMKTNDKSAVLLKPTEKQTLASEALDFKGCGQKVPC